MTREEIKHQLSKLSEERSKIEADLDALHAEEHRREAARQGWTAQELDGSALEEDFLHDWLNELNGSIAQCQQLLASK